MLFRRRVRFTELCLVVIAVGSAALTGCAHNGNPSTGTAVADGRRTNSTTTGSSGPAAHETPSPTTGAATHDDACTGNTKPLAGENVIAGDLDGDGRPDTVRIGSNEVEAVTATGGRSVVALDSARGAYLLGVVDADGDERAEIFIDLDRGGSAFLGPDLPNGVDVVVAHLVACRLTLTKNASGEAYRFAVGGDEAVGRYLGVGCVDADHDGRTDLVGLRGERHDERVDWTRTVVRLSQGTASNAATDSGTYQSSDPAVALLGRATCGPDPLDGP